MISIVVPAYNEEGNVERLCADIAFALQDHNFEIIIIDDASTDSTFQKLQILTKEYANLKVLRNSSNLGIVKSWQHGLNNCDFKFACLIDADLQIRPTEIRVLLEALDPTIDMAIQGVREHIKGPEIHRNLLSRALNQILNVSFSQRSIDSKSGFVLTQTSLLKEFCNLFCDLEYGQTFLGVWLRKRVPIVVELPVRFYPRVSGKSFITKFTVPIVSLKVFHEIIRVIFNQSKYFVDFLSLYRNAYSSLENISVNKRVYFFTLPFHSWNLSRHTADMYRRLRNVEFENLATYQEIQAKRLRRLLSSAKYHSPHYRVTLSKLDVTQINSENYLKVLATVPCLEKDTIRQNGDLILNGNARFEKLSEISTSGSTGQPMKILVDRFQLSVRFASSFRALEGIGWNIGERQIRLWHQTLGMSPTQILKERLNAIVLRRHFVPAFKIEEKKVQQLVDKVNRFKPSIIEGYAESLNMISLFSTSQAKWSPKAILSSAQELTDSTRKNIEKIFSTKVLDKYGAREFSGIAYECTKQVGMHILMESYIVEILLNGHHVEPGETGEVFITDLNNSVFPLIRYRIGDLATLSSDSSTCECGRSTTKLTKIIGRTQALIKGSNGVLVPGTYFSHLFKDFTEYIASYQVHQDTKSRITIKLIPTLSYSQKMDATIVSLLRETLGHNTNIKLEIVTNIPLGPTGKRQSVVSEIYDDFQNLQSKKLFF
jgi:phenylacetate-CoA ligase